jgi:16S rRNA (cytosine1402-N4)-methyltransferase
MSHAPVLLSEAIEALAPRAGGVYVDATFGGGGYSRAILEAARCRVIGIDRDPEALTRAGELLTAYPQAFHIIPGAFGGVEKLVDEAVDGVVFDLGVSSFQIDQPERGFSFRFDGPLDMRMSREGPSAADAVAHLSEEALANALARLGEEPQARRFARAIVRERAEAPIRTTGALAVLIEQAAGGRKGAKIHPATRTFQALRLLVNDELGELARALSGSEHILKPGGRLVTVAFHSLEDRLVKSFLAARSGAREGGSRHMPEARPGPASSFAQPMRKGVGPSEAETAANPRARSARLRWAERTDAPSQGPFEPAPLAPLAQAEWERLSG